MRATYKDLHAKRPICQKLIDHTEEIQPRREMDETSEYRDTLNKIEVRNVSRKELFDNMLFSGHENRGSDNKIPDNFDSDVVIPRAPGRAKNLLSSLAFAEGKNWTLFSPFDPEFVFP